MISDKTHRNTTGDYARWLHAEKSRLFLQNRPVPQAWNLPFQAPSDKQPCREIKSAHWYPDRNPDMDSSGFRSQGSHEYKGAYVNALVLTMRTVIGL